MTDEARAVLEDPAKLGRLLERTGSQNAAAEELRVSHWTLHERRVAYGIPLPNRKPRGQRPAPIRSKRRTKPPGAGCSTRRRLTSAYGSVSRP